jgi:predicted transcriptional regulator
MKVLLSIKPEFVDRIFDGSKRFEFRKNLFKRDGINKVVIYSTMPVGKVVGEFEIKSIFLDEVAKLWSRTSKHSGISQSFFDEYYQGKEKGVAIQIGKLTKYSEPLPLSHLGANITAPQSYRYL